jgi:predicted lipoprotein with Yx(FWY)xxD motif
MKGHEIPLWNKGGYLNTIMDIAHGVTTSTTTKDKSKVVSTIKGYCGVNSPPKASKNVVEHKPSPNYTCDYVVTLDHNGKWWSSMSEPTPRRLEEECVGSKSLCF